MTAHQKIEASHANVYSALCAAQMEMGPLVKGSVNPAFKSKYADLSDLVTAVRGPLNANGLAYFHQIISLEGDRYMRTLLVHGPSDTRIECDVPLIVAKNDMQGMKSATTYAKRIGLESVTGVAADDDDGNAAAAAAPARQQTARQLIEPEAPKPAAAEAVTEALGCFDKADTIDAANAIWRDLPAALKADQRVIDAAKAAKARNAKVAA